MAAILAPSMAFEREHDAIGRVYDAADNVERIETFDDSYVDGFIADFAKSQGDAEMWLQDQGIDKTCIATADMLRYMSQRWITEPLRVYDAAGIHFWREMRKLAYEVWSGK